MYASFANNLLHAVKALYKKYQIITSDDNIIILRVIVGSEGDYNFISNFILG